MCLFVEKYVCFFLFWASNHFYQFSATSRAATSQFLSLELKKKSSYKSCNWVIHFTAVLPCKSPLKAHRFFWGLIYPKYVLHQSCTFQSLVRKSPFFRVFSLAHLHETCGKTQGFQEAVDPISIQRRALRGCMEFLGSGWIFTLRWRMGLEYLSIFTINWSHKCR